MEAFRPLDLGRKLPLCELPGLWPSEFLAQTETEEHSVEAHVAPYVTNVYLVVVPGSAMELLKLGFPE